MLRSHMLFVTSAVARLRRRGLARFSFWGIVCLLTPVPARAQDPLVVLPDVYKLGFENEHVRVVRVRYEPHAKLPPHDHPKGPTAYVYLNDGGPVVFKHIGLDYGEITRPATVAGGVRLARPVEEVHEVENPNDSPSEFLRVEFKTLSAEAGRIRGKFLPEPHPPDENFSKVLFENVGLLVKRQACVPMKPCDLGPSDGRLPAAGRPGERAHQAAGGGQRADGCRRRAVARSGDGVGPGKSRREPDDVPDLRAQEGPVGIRSEARSVDSSLARMHSRRAWRRSLKKAKAERDDPARMIAPDERS